MENRGGKPAILHRRFRKEMLKLASEYNIQGYKYYILKPNISEFLLMYDYEHGFEPLNQMGDLRYPITFHLKNTNIFLNIIITNMAMYPFSPPKLILKNRDLQSYYYSNLFIKYKKYLTEPKKCCLVCSSILSSSNWHCIASFEQIFEEMLRNFINIKRAIEMIHLEKVFLKNIGDEYLIKHVLNYL